MENIFPENYGAHPDELKNLMVLAETGMNTTKALKRAFKKNKNLQGTLVKLTELDQLIINSMSKDIAGFILQNFINSLLKDIKKKSGLEIIQNSYGLVKVFRLLTTTYFFPLLPHYYHSPVSTF